jgi:hypothetical protein
LVRFIHRADSLAAGAVSCRLMSSTFIVSLRDGSLGKIKQLERS